MRNNPNTYWTAFYTKPRTEKKAAERLCKNGFEVYCPTRTVLKQWSDRKKKVREVIFTSYIFAKVDEPQRQKILFDQSIISSVHWLGKPVVIKDCEIKEIQMFLSEYPEANGVSSGEFQPGQEAKIVRGPLDGESGVVREIRGNRVILEISSLGIGLQAEVSLNKIEHLKYSA